MEKDQTDKLLDELIGNDKKLKRYSDAVNLGFDIAVKVRELRESMHMSQAEFAKLSGKSKSTIARIESGATNIKLSTLSDIARASNKHLKIEFI